MPISAAAVPVASTTGVVIVGVIDPLVLFVLIVLGFAVAVAALELLDRLITRSFRALRPKPPTRDAAESAKPPSDRVGQR